MRVTHQTETKLYVRGRIATAMAVVGGVLVLPGWILNATGHSQVGIPLFITGMILVAGSSLFFGAFEQLATMRLIQDLPTSKISTAHQGYVELKGVVGDRGRFITCRCGQACLWYECIVNKKRVAPTGKTPDIILDDGTGQCLVNAAGSELYATDDYTGHVHLKPGDVVHVLGEFRSASTAVPGAATPEERARKATLRSRLEALKRDTRSMALFDRDKDGHVDSREWDAAVKATEFKLAREPGPAKEQRPDHVIGKPTTESDRLPFVIYVGNEAAAIARARSEFIRRLVVAIPFSVVITIMVLQFLTR